MRDVRDYMAARHTQRYDFDRAPLYSLRAFVRDDGVDLVFAFHHAILDGWSVANLIRELVQDYLFRLGIDVPPIDTEVHSATMLAEYVRLEREALESPAAQEFWRQALAGSHATSLESYVAHEPPATADPDVTVLIPQWLQDAAATTRKVSRAADEVAAARRALRYPTKTLGRGGRHDRAGHPRAPRSCRRRSGRRAVSQHDPDSARRQSPATWLDAVEHIARFERASHRYRRYPLQAMQSDAGRPLFNTAFNFVNYHLFAELAGATGVELLEFEAARADELRAAW